MSDDDLVFRVALRVLLWLAVRRHQHALKRELRAAAPAAVVIVVSARRQLVRLLSRHFIGAAKHRFDFLRNAVVFRLHPPVAHRR